MFLGFKDWVRVNYPGKHMWVEDEYGHAEDIYCLQLLDFAKRSTPQLEIVAQYGTWAVDADGLVHLRDGYWIEKKSLPDEDWPLHISEKRHVDMHDFLRAFYAARHYHYPRHFPSLNDIWRMRAKVSDRESVGKALRFQVLQRDNYRCCICGRNAKSGVELRIDHIIPVARGGRNNMNNLQTLCHDCNAGKRDSFV